MSACDNYENLLVVVGIVYVAIILLKILQFIYASAILHFILKFRKVHLKNYGEWAVITGGNSGIGQSYAYQLAGEGMNVLIVSRTLNTLKNTAEDIRKKYAVQCDYVQVDFAEGERVYSQLRHRLAGIDIGILVNSAGIAGKTPCYFLEESDENVISMLELHIRAVVQMTRIATSSMLSKKKGVVVTVSSMLSQFPTPLTSLYSSCKAFSDDFSRALYWENEEKNVHFQSLIPFFVSTKMASISGANLSSFRIFMISVDDFIKGAVKSIGFSHRLAGHWKHAIFGMAVSLVPNYLRWSISFRQSTEIRLKLIRRNQKTQ